MLSSKRDYPSNFKPRLRVSFDEAARYDDNLEAIPANYTPGLGESAAFGDEHDPSQPHDRRLLQAAQSHASHLEEANHQLLERLQEALGDLESVQAQMMVLQRTQRAWEDRVPEARELAAAALESERVAQEARNAHAL